MNNTVRTILLFGGISALLVAVGAAFGPAQLAFFSIFALIMNIGAYYYSDKLVLKMHGARELQQADSPALFSMVRELSQIAKIPMPRIYLIPSPEANAFATGRDPAHGAVAFTDGILRLLSDRELRGVTAHELSHIKNRDILIATVAAIAASAISTVANVAQFSALFGSREHEEGGNSVLGNLALIFIAPLVATLLQLGISRSREYIADASGAKICGDPEGLAMALASLHGRARHQSSQFQPALSSLYIVNPFSALGGMASLFSTHPAVDERIQILMAMVGKRVAA